MVVKREKKPTKKRKVTTKKKSKNINKNINMQTVIINQPKPTRRRKAPTKKQDKFSDPTSSLGIITNLITRFQPTQQPNDQLQQLTESVKQLQLQAPPLTQLPSFPSFVNQGDISQFGTPEPLSRSPSMASTMDFSDGDTVNNDTFRENIKQSPERPDNLRRFSNVSELTTDTSIESPPRASPVKTADESITSPKKQKMLLSNFFSPKKKVVSQSSSFSSGGAVGGGGGGDSLEDQLSALSISSSQIETRNAKKKIKDAENDLLTKKTRLDNAVSKGTVKEGTLKNYESQLKASQDRLQKLKDKS